MLAGLCSDLVEADVGGDGSDRVEGSCRHAQRCQRYRSLVLAAAGFRDFCVALAVARIAYGNQREERSIRTTGWRSDRR